MTNEQKQQLKKALEIAREHRDQLVDQRNAIERELAQQSKAVAALAEILGESPDTDMGLTAATQLVIRISEVPLAPTEIRDKLREIGYDISSFSNPMASLHQVLKRLAEKKIIFEGTSVEGKKQYYSSEHAAIPNTGQVLIWGGKKRSS